MLLTLVLMIAVLPDISAQESGEPLQPNPSGDQTLSLNGPIVLESLDPAFSRDLETMFVVRQVFAGLMRFGDELQPVPNIASDVSISDDGLVYTFRLDPDARLYSGRTIVADDVVFSLQRALDPATANGNTAALAGPTFLADIAGASELLTGQSDTLSGVVALDETMVQITLTRPRSTFLMRLAAAPASIVDKDDMSLGVDWWRTPNASGAFAIEAIFDNDRIDLVANQHFVGGQPLLEKVTLRIGTNAFGQFSLYEEDAIDMAGVDLFNVERVLDPENPLNADLTQTPLFATEYIAFGTTSEPLDDPFIRKALMLGFPRDEIAEVSFNGRVATPEGLIPDKMLGVDRWSIDGADFDLDAARAAIASSRYGSAEGVPPIEIYAASPARAESFRDFIEENLGLKIEIYAVEWSDFLTDLTNQHYPAYLLFWGADYPDPETFLLTLFGSDSSDNYIGYSNPAFDELLDRAAAELDPVLRAALYSQANQMLMDDGVVLPLYYDVAYTLIKPWVRNLTVTPLGVLYLDQVWIER